MCAQQATDRKDEKKCDNFANMLSASLKKKIGASDQFLGNSTVPLFQRPSERLISFLSQATNFFHRPRAAALGGACSLTLADSMPGISVPAAPIPAARDGYWSDFFGTIVARILGLLVPLFIYSSSFGICFLSGLICLYVLLQACLFPAH